MKYLNAAVFDQISAQQFLDTKPFPFLNPVGALFPERFLDLTSSLPDISLFTKTEGVERKYGQKPHDRYELMYSVDVPLAEPWRDFIKEIFASEYQSHIARIFGVDSFVTRLQWQYAYSGCSVSPHCDSPKKLGSQIFYMNTNDNWDDSWGGKTLVLDDRGEKDCNSAPNLSEFTVAYASEILGNRSFIFKRTEHSWHAVEEIHPPEGKLRKLFTVVFDYAAEPRKNFFQNINPFRT